MSKADEIINKHWNNPTDLLSAIPEMLKEVASLAFEAGEKYANGFMDKKLPPDQKQFIHSLFK